MLERHLKSGDIDKIHVDEEYRVFGDFTVGDYRHGRCHLLALVLSEIKFLDLGIIIDPDGFDDSPDPILCLQHAYCVTPDGLAIDAQGAWERSEISDDFASDVFDPITVEGEDARALLDKIELDDFLPGERDALKAYVREMDRCGLFRVHGYPDVAIRIIAESEARPRKSRAVSQEGGSLSP